MHEAAMSEMGVAWDTCWSALPETANLSPGQRADTRARLEAIVARIPPAAAYPATAAPPLPELSSSTCVIP